MGSNPNVVGILPNHLGQMFVNGDPARLEGFTADLLFLVTDQMTDVRKQIDRRTFVTDIKNTNFRFRNATTIPGFDIRFILLVPITPCGTTTHAEI